MGPSGEGERTGGLEWELGRLARRLRAKRTASEATIDVRPTSAFDAVLEQRLKDLERNFGELKGRVNGLIFLVVGALLVQVLLRLFA